MMKKAAMSEKRLITAFLLCRQASMFSDSRLVLPAALYYCCSGFSEASEAAYFFSSL